MTDWAAAYRQSGHHDRDDVRERTSIELVLSEELGTQFDEYGNALCPFHPDSNPSFRIFESDDGRERAACWSCEWRGDVFDVIRAARPGTSFGEAVQLAASLYADAAAPERQRAGSVGFPQHVMQAASRAAWSRAAQDMGPLHRFVAAKGLHVPADFLFWEFFVGVGTYVGAGTIHIPHMNPAREVLGFKTRNAGTPPVAAPGSKFTELYGVWRDPGTGPVLVMEGESDTWSAAWLTGDRAAVVGLPTGANSPIRAHWLEWFTNREVVTLFDPDKQGMDAAVRWTDRVGADAVFLGAQAGDFSKMPLDQQRNVIDMLLG